MAAVAAGSTAIPTSPAAAAPAAAVPPAEEAATVGRTTVDRARADRIATASACPGSVDEPWSEVPPELEAMLRAQLAATRRRPTGIGRQIVR